MSPNAMNLPGEASARRELWCFSALSMTLRFLPQWCCSLLMTRCGVWRCWERCQCSPVCCLFAETRWLKRWLQAMPATQLLQDRSLFSVCVPIVIASM